MSSTFTGGKLKLKGSKPGKVSKNKKKKKKEQDDSKELALIDGDDDTGLQTTEDGYAVSNEEKVDTRTAAERKFDERASQLEVERVSKLAAKSHREKVREFNERIARETEHFDIPRVGPG